MKNILILALNNDIEFCDFTDENNEFHEKYNNITEAVTKYLIYKLEREQKTLDYIFILVKKEDFTNGNYERFRNIFPQIPTDYVILSDGSIKENLPLAPEFIDRIIDYKSSVNEDINIAISLSDYFEFNSIIKSLVELIQYNSFCINQVLYANVKKYPHIIEEVSDFIKIPALIKGAEDFIYNGKTDKILEFFPKEQSGKDMEVLIEKMTGFSETLKICGNYDVTKKAANELANAIKNYEKSLDVKLNNLLNQTNALSAELKKCSNFEAAKDILNKLNNAITEYKEAATDNQVIDINEFYFNKLLPKIKCEYDEILPKANHKQSPIDIIRWSLKMGFIQQAVVFFTEWIPEFLVEEKYIEVDKSIEEECIKRGQNFSSWTVHFFRAYQPKIPSSALNAEQLKEIFQKNKTLDEIINKIKGKHSEIEKNLKEVCDFFKGFRENEKVTDKILSLAQNNFTRKLIVMTQVLDKLTNMSFEEYVKNTFTTAKKAQTHLINRLRNNTPQKELKKLFDLTNIEAEFTKDNLSRAEIMKYLSDNDLIRVPNKFKKNFLDFVDNYELVVQYFRNKMAHAVINDTVVVRQDKFVKIISDSLDLIDIK